MKTFFSIGKSEKALAGMLAIISSTACSEDTSSHFEQAKKEEAIGVTEMARTKVRHSTTPRKGENPSWIFKNHNHEANFKYNPCSMDSERMAFIGNYENKKTLKHLAWNGNKQVENLTLENSTKIMMPTDPFYEENGIKKADIWVNFNGVQFAPRWAKEMKKTVLVNVELGEGSDVYKKRFEVAGVFRKVMEAILENIENKTGENITLGRVGLSSWSAGYGAIESILSHQEFKKKIDAVMILDGLHGAYEGTDDGETMSLNDSYMNDIADFARNAANDERLFFGLTHSSIVPPNYPSTTENARWLTWQLGGDEPKVNAPFIATGLRKISSFENGGAFIDGYAGMDEDAHCAMFQTMPKLLKKVKKVGFE